MLGRLDRGQTGPQLGGGRDVDGQLVTGAGQHHAVVGTHLPTGRNASLLRFKQLPFHHIGFTQLRQEVFFTL